jgi:hypothetical protein
MRLPRLRHEPAALRSSAGCLFLTLSVKVSNGTASERSPHQALISCHLEAPVGSGRRTQWCSSVVLAQGVEP